MGPEQFKYSVVIPVYRSEQILNNTIDRTVAFFEAQGWDYEIVMVNDGSPDNSWEILEARAAGNPHIVAVDLLKNYGQHTAIFCGFHYATGDYIITMDDDLQNPPEEIVHLVHKALEGYDAVYGRFRHKEHAGYRRMGSRLIELVNRRVFDLPKDLTVTNFRCLERRVINRIIDYNTAYPYITGLSLMFSNRRANVWVEHHSRAIGKSGYNWRRLLSLVGRIVFNYSAYPLRLVSGIGFVTAGLAFLLGIYILVRALVIGYTVPGWATVVLLLAFFNGINIAIMSMMAEYIVRLVKQISAGKVFQVAEVLNEPS